MRSSHSNGLLICAALLSALLCFASCKKTDAPKPQSSPATNAELSQTEQVYESQDGWSVHYHENTIKCNASNAHAVKFIDTTSKDNNNYIQISYISNKQPEEVLAEITSVWGNEMNVNRSQNYFPGTKDKWAYWRVLDEKTEDRQTVKTAVAAEYNDGVLLLESVEHKSGNETQDTALSDTFSNLINSISYKDFKPQTIYDYVPGTYLPETPDIIESISLNKDYTGTLVFKDKTVNVLWGSIELSASDGTTYEYTIEGDNLMLNYNDQWISLSKSTPNPQAKSLPPYQYPGNDPIHKAIADYLTHEIAKNFDPSDVCIPSMTIIATDTTNPDDTLAWGDYWVFNYKLDQNTLLTESGGSHPGLIHLKKSDESYTVTSMDLVADGSDNLQSAKKIFGDKYDDFHKINSSQDEREKVRRQFISDYVKSNNLPITKVKDFGWDPVDLP